MMAGILRCVLILRDPVGGAQQAGSWAVRETFVAVIIGNIPMIYPFLRRNSRRFLDSAAFRSISLSQQTNSHAKDAGHSHRHQGGTAGSGSRGLGGRGARSLYPLTDMGGTFSDSAERIVGMEQGVGLADDGSQSGKSSKTGITVITATVVQDRERQEGETTRQENQWPLSKKDGFRL